MKKITRMIAFFLILSLTAGLTVSATTVKKKKEEKAKNEKELAAVNEKIKKLEKEKAAVAAEIAALDSALVDLLLNLEMIESDLQLKTEQVAQAEADYEAAKEKAEKQYEDMKLRIKYMYEEGEQDVLSMLLESESIADFLNKKDFVQTIHETDREMLDEYQETQAQLAEIKEQLEQEKADLETLQEEYEHEKASVEAQLAEQRKLQSNFDSQLATASQQAKSYRDKIKQQQSEINALEAEQRKKQQQANTNKGNGGTSSGGSSSGGGTSNGSSSSSGGATVSGGGNGAAIASYACQFIGNPYVYGGTSLTNGADCSGFTQSVFAHFGISIPRSSGEQGSGGKAVSYSEAQLGDILFYGGHVAIYIGGGRIVHASTEKTGIKTDNAQYRTILSVRRYW